jgi:hypothetical protein
MGSGKREWQVEKRFGQGTIGYSPEPCSKPEAPQSLGIGEYEIESGIDGFMLKRGDEVLGTYKEVKVLSPERALFGLERGMFLEVSPQGVRKTLSPEKAGMAGFISSDGALSPPSAKSKRIDFYNTSDELLDKFAEFMKEVYGVAPRRHQIKNREHLFMLDKGSKDIVEDMREYTHKGLKKNYWEVPFDYLDKESARMFLKCFMSGDGHIGWYPRSHPRMKLPLQVRFCSKNTEGLEQIQHLLEEDFGISHTSIYPGKNRSVLEITSTDDKVEYIAEIGSFKENHVEVIERALKVIREE